MIFSIFSRLRWSAIALGLLGACAAKRAPLPAPAPPRTTVSVAPESTDAPVAATKKPASGGRELVKQIVAIDGIEEPTERWFKREKALQELRSLADPRAADALHAYLTSNQKFRRPSERAHARTEVAFALAELGDRRAVPALAERLALDPLTLYAEDLDYEVPLRRTDQERIVSARLIGDLAELHPDQRTEIRNQAESAVWAWITSAPMPHANGLRALARMKSESAPIRTQLRSWADPKTPLPKVGQQPPFPSEIEVAQSGLRYLGAIGDDKAFPILEKQLKRRPKTFDATMDALLSSGGALLGMSLRALEVGSANGLSELGDAKAFVPLSKLVADDKENEQARVAACQALVWVAGDGEAKEIAKRIAARQSPNDKAARFRLLCVLDGLAQRPLAPTRAALLGLFESDSPEVRHAAARALGKAGLEPETEAKLVAGLGDGTRGSDAALALLLGGSIESAKAVVAAHKTPVEIGELYLSSFASVSQEDLDRGRFFRWVHNALAGEAAWPREHLKMRLAELVYDSGPHTLTRVVLRTRLFDLAKSAAPDAKKSALAALELMDERGVLLALDES